MPSPGIHYAMLRVWHLRSLAFRRISPRHCSYSSCHKSSISCSPAHSCSDSFPALGTGYQGMATINRTCLDLPDCRFDPNTNLLHPSKALFFKPPSRLATMILRIISILGLTELTLHPKTGVILESNNLTILNFFLLRLGPMNERRLVQVLMLSQVTILVVLVV